MFYKIPKFDSSERKCLKEIHSSCCSVLPQQFSFMTKNPMVKLSATFTFLHFCLLACMCEELCSALFGKERGLLAMNSNSAQTQGAGFLPTLCFTPG